MSVLLQAEVDGEKLTQLQIDLFFMLLQNAGSETTRNLITTGHARAAAAARPAGAAAGRPRRGCPSPSRSCCATSRR